MLNVNGFVDKEDTTVMHGGGEVSEKHRIQIIAS